MLKKTHGKRCHMCMAMKDSGTSFTSAEIHFAPAVFRCDMCGVEKPKGTPSRKLKGSAQSRTCNACVQSAIGRNAFTCVICNAQVFY
jgi:hypothetical protein